MKFKKLIFFFVATAAAHAEERNADLYWTPSNATVGGHEVDHLLRIIFWLTAGVFVATQAVYIIYLVRYRRRPGVRAHYSHGHNRLEFLWTLVPTLIFLALAFSSNHIWEKIHRDPPADAIPIGISAFQFGWDIRYPGPDGKLGAMNAALISPDNKFGVDPADPAGRDDFTASELVIPVHHPIHIFLSSRDVVHSFYVPNFRIYQDAVPGRTISWVWFEVERTGHFELVCSQLCGSGHYNMKAPIRVIAPEEYEKWCSEKNKPPQALPGSSP